VSSVSWCPIQCPMSGIRGLHPQVGGYSGTLKRGLELKWKNKLLDRLEEFTFHTPHSNLHTPPSNLYIQFWWKITKYSNSKIIFLQFIFIFLLWAVFLLEEKYACILFALAHFFFSIVFDWRVYKSTWEKIAIFNKYLPRNNYFFTIIFLVIAYMFQNQQYTEIPSLSEILPIFNDVSQTVFFMSIIQLSLLTVWWHFFCYSFAQFFNFLLLNTRAVIYFYNIIKKKSSSKFRSSTPQEIFRWFFIKYT